MIINALLYVVLTVAFQYFDKAERAFGKLSNRNKQIIIGIAFGLATCFASDAGFQIPGAIINVRDAGPLCAALLFGAPAGVISGVMGAVYRLFWGTTFASTFTAEWLNTMFSVDANGGFTRVACTCGTLLAGLIGAFIRKQLFDDKIPTPNGALAIGVTVEMLHLAMVFMFRLNYLERGLQVLLKATPLMVTGNALILALCTFIVCKMKGVKITKRWNVRSLTSSFRTGILITVSISFLLLVAATYGLEYKLGVKQTEALLAQNLDDVTKEYEDSEGSANIESRGINWHIGKTGGIIIGEMQRGADGESAQLTVTNDGAFFKKGQVLDGQALTGKHPYKTADNFVESSISIDGTDTKVYAMYKTVGNGKMAIAFVPVKEATVYQRITVLVAIYLGILMFAALFVVVYLLVKKLVLENINKVNETLESITGGNLDAVVDVRTHSEFASLSDDINDTVAALKRYIEEAARRIDEELELARDIQASALPRDYPVFPNRRDLDLYATMYTAKEVGGDFYDYYFTNTDRLNCTVADVSGKGVPAALFMMTSKTLLKSNAEKSIPINEVLTLANNELCENNDANMFVTVLSLDIDLMSGLVKCANAGHNPMLICHKGEQFEYFRERPDFVLAGIEDICYKAHDIQLSPGDVVFMYTDGVTEATDANQKLYGEDRLQSILNRNIGCDMEKLCAAVKEDIDKFVGDAEQFDDMTMLAFKYYGLPSITFDAVKVEDVPAATEFVEAELEKIECPVKIIQQMNIAIDEIVSNIGKFAYPDSEGPLTIKVDAKLIVGTVSVQFIDEGIPYNPLVEEDPDITLSAEERSIGGLGIYLVKQMMDDVNYRYEDNKNILTLTKNLKEA